MAIGTTAAILGSAALAAGTGIAGSRAQSSAARNAAQTAQQDTAANNALQREIYYDQRGLYQPFYRSDLARRGALDELFGINAINQPQAQGAGGGINGIMAGGGTQGGAGGMGGGNAGVMAYSPALTVPQGIDGMAAGGPSDGNAAAMNALGLRSPMRAIGDGINRPPGVQNYMNQNGGQLPPAQQMANTNGPLSPQVQDTQGVTDPNAVTTTPTQQGLFNSSIPGADRFNNSLFNPLAQTMFNQDRDRIDANLAASGMLYNGVRQTAVQEAGNRAAQGALGMYLNTLMGAPTSQAASGLSNAAGQYGQNVQANNTAGANAVMQSQLAQGQARSDMWGNLGSAAGFGLSAFT